MKAQNFTKRTDIREIRLDDYELALAVVQYIHRQSGENFETGDVVYSVDRVEVTGDVTAVARIESESKARKVKTVPVAEEL